MYISLILSLVNLDNIFKNKIRDTSEINTLSDEYQNKQIDFILDGTMAINDNMKQNFDYLLKEVAKLKQENIEIKNQSLTIQNDLKPFLKSILDMQLYSFNNLKKYKSTIGKMATGMETYNKMFFNDLHEIKVYLNMSMTGVPGEKVNGNVFSDALIKNKDSSKSRFLDKGSKINFKKNARLDTIKNHKNKDFDFSIDP